MAVITVYIKIVRTINPTENKKLEKSFGESIDWVNENIKKKLPSDATMDNPRYEVQP